MLMKKSGIKTAGFGQWLFNNHFFIGQPSAVDQATPQPFDRSAFIKPEPKNRENGLHQPNFNNDKIKLQLGQFPEITKTISIEKESAEYGLQEIITEEAPAQCGYRPP